jgi:hypothetical protein
MAFGPVHIAGYNMGTKSAGIRSAKAGMAMRKLGAHLDLDAGGTQIRPATTHP